MGTASRPGSSGICGAQISQNEIEDPYFPETGRLAGPDTESGEGHRGSRRGRQRDV
jgi:hypothetical protein